MLNYTLFLVGRGMNNEILTLEAFNTFKMREPYHVSEEFV